MLLSICLCACGETQSLDGSALRPEYSAALDEAINAWNHQLGCDWFSRDDSGGEIEVSELNSQGAWAARWWPSQRRIEIAPDTVGGNALVALEHEMGHALGLGHVDDYRNLMYRGTLVFVGGPETTGLRCDSIQSP